MFDRLTDAEREAMERSKRGRDMNQRGWIEHGWLAARDYYAEGYDAAMAEAVRQRDDANCRIGQLEGERAASSWPERRLRESLGKIVACSRNSLVGDIARAALAAVPEDRVTIRREDLEERLRDPEVQETLARARAAVPEGPGEPREALRPTIGHEHFGCTTCGHITQLPYQHREQPPWCLHTGRVTWNAPRSKGMGWTQMLPVRAALREQEGQR